MAKTLLYDLGLEVLARVDRPAVAGDTLQLACATIDVKEGIYSFVDVGVADHSLVDGKQAELLLEADGEGQDLGEARLITSDVEGVVGDDVGARDEAGHRV